MNGRPSILITGGTGFVGRCLVASLRDSGFSLTLAVREISRCPEEWQSDPSLRLVEVGEIGPATDFRSALGDSSAVVHLAGLAHVTDLSRAGKDEPYRQVNVEGTRALVEAARQTRITTFVNLSSLFAVTANVANSIVDDTTTPAPTTPYGRSKLAAEGIVAELAENGILAVSLRPTLVIGSTARGNWAALQAVVSTPFPLPFGSMRNRRSFLSVQSLVSAITRLVTGGYSAEHSGQYCMADQPALELRDVVKLLREGMGKPANLFPMPTAAFAAIGFLSGRRRQFAALTGQLEVAPDRFCNTFNWAAPLAIADAIRQSGAEFAVSRGTATQTGIPQ